MSSLGSKFQISMLQLQTLFWKLLHFIKVETWPIEPSFMVSLGIIHFGKFSYCWKVLIVFRSAYTFFSLVSPFKALGTQSSLCSYCAYWKNPFILNILFWPFSLSNFFSFCDGVGSRFEPIFFHNYSLLKLGILSLRSTPNEIHLF